MNRIKASLIHLFVSLLIALAVWLLIRTLWFPGALFDASGGTEGITILIGVDLILGPVLTLVVYNQLKPKTELTRDLSIIVTLQLACLVAGLYLIHSVRPMAVVFEYDRFHVVNKSQFDQYEVEQEKVDGALSNGLQVFQVGSATTDMAHNLGMILSRFNHTVPLYLQLDEYKPLEAEAVERAREEDDESCLRIKLESLYQTGSVCFDPIEQSFSAFIADS